MTTPYLAPADRAILQAAADGQLHFVCGRWAITDNSWPVPNRARRRLASLGLLDCAGLTAVVTAAGAAAMVRTA